MTDDSLQTRIPFLPTRIPFRFFAGSEGEAALGFGIGQSPSRVRNRLLGSYKHKNAAIGSPSSRAFRVPLKATQTSTTAATIAIAL
jgi:hypothetical protein